MEFYFTIKSITLVYLNLALISLYLIVGSVASPIFFRCMLPVEIKKEKNVARDEMLFEKEGKLITLFIILLNLF